jgi:hypothetical protein
MIYLTVQNQFQKLINVKETSTVKRRHTILNYFKTSAASHYLETHCSGEVMLRHMLSMLKSKNVKLSLQLAVRRRGSRFLQTRSLKYVGGQW